MFINKLTDVHHYYSSHNEISRNMTMTDRAVIYLKVVNLHNCWSNCVSYDFPTFSYCDYINNLEKKIE